ncbi:MAG: hypothetical protein ACYCST_22030, partial [Acidimicrobiales bacterium]
PGDNIIIYLYINGTEIYSETNIQNTQGLNHIFTLVYNLQTSKNNNYSFSIQQNSSSSSQLIELSATALT